MASAPASGTAAFGRLYQAHFDGLYDFVARMVRDGDLAGEIVQSTFTKAWDELRAGRELRHPQAWLYTVARNRALDELRRRRPLADESLVYAQADPSRLSDPQAVAEDSELVELVWSSAAALSPDEYSLLDLHVRHGFGAAELADELHLERGAVYTRLSRLRNSLEESVTSTLLVRRGREACPELAAIVAEHDGGDAITPALRRAVRDHVATCDVCAASRRRVASPVALFGALVPIVPLAAMREGGLAAILPAGGHAAAAGGAGAVTAARHSSRARYLVGAGGVAAAAAVAALALSAGSPKVVDPARAASVDHTVGAASADRTVTMHWSPGKHAKGYSVMFSQHKLAEPPARENVTRTTYTSSPLAPGRWWFILRTHGDGSWTHTLRVGPFVITAGVARAEPATVKHGPKRPRHRHRAKPPKHVASPPVRPAQVVAGVPAAPQPKPTAPAPVPPKRRPKKKAPPKPAPPRTTPAPPKTTPPPPKTTPPPASTPPAQPPPPQPSVGPTPPVVQPPPPCEDGCEHGQGEHEGNGGGGDGSQGGKGHGGGEGRGD